MKDIVCKFSLLSVGLAMLLMGGCGNDAHARFASEVMTGLTKVCQENGDPRKYGTELMSTISTMKDGKEQKQMIGIICDTVAAVTFKGEMSSERENGYFKLRDFVSESSRILRECNDDWGAVLELWLAEVACLKKESDICMKEHMRLMHLAKNAKSNEMAENMLFVANEMLHCAQYSATFHEQNMSLIVLWDDSVAARYCATLPWWRKMIVVWRIRKAIGRYPDWYLAEKK